MEPASLVTRQVVATSIKIATCDEAQVTIYGGGGNCTRDSNSASYIPQTTCEHCPLGLSDLCRDDEGIREIVGNWHRLTPEVREKIINLIRSSVVAL